jgi:hypothetical protein
MMEHVPISRWTYLQVFESLDDENRAKWSQINCNSLAESFKTVAEKLPPEHAHKCYELLIKQTFKVIISKNSSPEIKRIFTLALLSRFDFELDQIDELKTDEVKELLLDEAWSEDLR